MTVYVIGYYGHNNVGDEQYKLTLAYVLAKQGHPDPVFVDCDRIHTMAFAADDTIILGGGDILNEYFLGDGYGVYAVFGHTKHELTALSVGIPFPSIVKEPFFRRINHFYIRTFVDTVKPAFLRPDQSWRIVVDASIFLLDLEPPPSTLFMDHLMGRLTHAGRPVLFVSLNANAIERSPNLFGELMLLLLNVSETYHFCLVPFSVEANFDDRVPARQAAEMLPHTHVTIVENPLDSFELIRLFGLGRMHLSMKFHSTLYSLYAGLPFVAVTNERKVRNFCTDIAYTTQYYSEATVGTAPLNLLSNVVPIASDILAKQRKHAHQMYGIKK